MHLLIETLEALPEARREEIAEMVIELAQAVQQAPGETALTPDQLAEASHRRATFIAGDPNRIDALIARLR